ncbi:MAG: hypothetical protein NZ602_06680 [Thermoguttaceae bacterium]|nr:hypothetical protein [Thermoguttaceae bacterium]MDW8037790.1 hypothetical protein [Thermoguttaceae bacterium]
MPEGSAAPRKGGIWVCILLTISWMVGCGGQQTSFGVRLAGRVTLQGQPLPPEVDARIRFMPTAPGQGQPVEVQIVNSQYQASNVPKGKLIVLWYITRPTGQLRIDPNSPDGYPKEAVRENLVPERYRQGIPLEVSADNLELNFDLR